MLKVQIQGTLFHVLTERITSWTLEAICSNFL